MNPQIGIRTQFLHIVAITFFVMMADAPQGCCAEATLLESSRSTLGLVAALPPDRVIQQ
jgi:hypothetical protein